jgi:hypothetical protein
MISSKQEFLDYLWQLNLSPTEAARLLSVTPRTVNRWLKNPHEISGPAEQALRAWIILKDHNVSWRPDCVPIPFLKEEEAEATYQIKNWVAKKYNLRVINIIKKVKKRGELSLPWQIDFKKGSIKLEKTIEVFFKMPSGKPRNVRRQLVIFGYKRLDDQSADIKHNQYLIEEAVFTIDEVANEKLSCGCTIYHHAQPFYSGCRHKIMRMLGIRGILELGNDYSKVEDKK